MIDHIFMILLVGGFLGAISPRLGMVYFILLGALGLAGVIH